MTNTVPLVNGSSAMQGERLVDNVTKRIREMIIQGELMPGQQLLQASLADRLGVSRTPLREAFRVLESEGLLQISNRNRTVQVVQFSADELHEMFELREVVDGLAARLAAQNGVSAEHEAELRRLLREMTSSEHDYDMARRAAAHLAFHALFVEISENPYVEAFAPLVRASSAALYYPTPTDPKVVEFPPENDGPSDLGSAMHRMDDNHREIVEAVIARDPARAERAARAHVVVTKASLKNLDSWLATMARSQSDRLEQTP